VSRIEEIRVVNVESLEKRGAPFTHQSRGTRQTADAQAFLAGSVCVIGRLARITGLMKRGDRGMVTNHFLAILVPKTPWIALRVTFGKLARID